MSCDGGVFGAEYDRGAALARRVKAETELDFGYYIGYSMDTPRLLDYIALCRELDSPSARFLQMNGFAPREFKDYVNLLGGLRNAGIELIDLTFYGTKSYHDRFAGRTGDFRILTDMLRASNYVNLPVHVSAPVTTENAGHLEELFRELEDFKTEDMRLYLPHAKGRGLKLEEKRLTRAVFDGLPAHIRERMPKVKTQTEAQWLAEGEFPEPSSRVLTLSLTRENIDRYEDMSAADMIRELEELDDAFYAAIPPAAELARLYGDPKGEKLYRYRDLVLLWTKKFVRDNGITLHDMTDERGHFSARS